MSNYWIARIHLYRGLQLAPTEPANSLISGLGGTEGLVHASGFWNPISVLALQFPA